MQVQEQILEFKPHFLPITFLQEVDGGVFIYILYVSCP